ncbi:MAG: CARDB domain-containing protein [Halobacteria archaeon]|nr:CARDB domain-containing protein [Halobacteria archaeon]
MKRKRRFLTAVLITLVALSTPAAAQQISRENVISGNHIKITVTNAKGGENIDLTDENTAAERNAGVNIDTLSVLNPSASSFQMDVYIPSTISAEDPEGVEALGYFRLESSDISSSGISGVDFVFSVSKKKLDGSPGNLVFYEETGSGWKKLGAKMTSDDGSSYVFEVSGSGLSTYTVGIKDASLELQSVSLGTDQVSKGESFEVTATVSNTGKAAGSYEANLTVDGEKVDSKTVEVSAGASSEVRFTHSFDEIGVYKIGVSGKSAGEVRVTTGSETSGENESGNNTDGGGSESGSNGTPGFGVVVALVAVAVGAAARKVT